MNAHINKLISENYNKYLGIAIGYSNGVDDPRDILQECLLYVCEMDIEKQDAISSYFDYYLFQMIKYSSISKTSKYQQKYNKILKGDGYNLDYLIDNDSLVLEESPKVTLEDIHKVLEEQCNWYEREVFLQYTTTDKSFKKFEEDTGIPASSLFNTYTKLKNILKENLTQWEEKRK